MNKWPSLKQLHYLVTLHRVRHFGEAAKQCFVSQSTLSKGIQNLEDLFGCQFYEKKDKKSQPVFTAEGDLAVLYGQQLLEQSQEWIKTVQRSQHEPMQGTLSLGCIPTIAPFLLSGLIKKINQVYPQLKLLLREDTTDNLRYLLKIGELDAAIFAMPVPLEGLECHVAGTDAFKMIMSQSLNQALVEHLDYDHLPAESILLLEKEHCLTEHAMSACRLTDNSKINPFQARSLHTLVNMVANGLGVTFVPEMAIRAGLLEGLDLLVTDPPEGKAHRQIAMVWRATSTRKLALKKLLAIVTQLIHQTETHAV